MHSLFSMKCLLLVAVIVRVGREGLVGGRERRGEIFLSFSSVEIISSARHHLAHTYKQKYTICNSIQFGFVNKELL